MTFYLQMDRRHVKRLAYKRSWMRCKRVQNNLRNSRAECTVFDDIESTKDVTESRVKCCKDKYESGMTAATHTERYNENHNENERMDALSNIQSDTSELKSISDNDENDFDESDDDYNDSNNDLTGAEKLALWANSNNITQKALDQLLGVLKDLNPDDLRDLPMTARTLLKTERSVKTVMLSNMEYINMGVTDSIKKMFNNYPEAVKQTTNEIPIIINIDGLPLFNSSKQTLWPVLCAIRIDPVQVFPFSLSLGDTKPSDLEFLSELIEELLIVLRDGISFSDRRIPVDLKCIVCDAPAKAMIKAVKQFSGYYGCDKCTQEGVWLQRMTYPNVDSFEKRTDASFRHQLQPQHHHDSSPFIKLPIDMIKQFPVDYMHQVCLGVMRRLMKIWFRGRARDETSVSADTIDVINGRLNELRRHVPDDFARKPRSLNDLEHWKATEFRQFLLYNGLHVLKGSLD